MPTIVVTHTLPLTLVLQDLTHYPSIQQAVNFLDGSSTQLGTLNKNLKSTPSPEGPSGVKWNSTGWSTYKGFGPPGPCGHSRG